MSVNLLQEQYWRIPADMTPAQLDEAAQALQPDGSHDNSNANLSEEPITREQEEDEGLNTTVEEPQQQQDDDDCTPPEEETVVDDDNEIDDGVQSDSSEQSGLCIDYQSDPETEGIHISSRTLHLNDY